jgi:hypothetical protein
MDWPIAVKLIALNSSLLLSALSETLQKLEMRKGDDLQDRKTELKETISSNPESNR